MELLSIILALLGSAVAAFGSFWLLFIPGKASASSQVLHDNGVSKIPDKAYSAALSACGFLILFLSFLTQLHSIIPPVLYWLIFVIMLCFSKT